MTAPSRRLRVMDGLGVLILFLYVGTAFVAAHQGGSAGPLAALLLATAAALLVGRTLGRVNRAIAPAAIVLAAIAIAATAGPVIGGGPLEGPFGYRNATGAFYVQAGVAALMMAAATRWRPLRVLGIALGIAFAVVAAADSMAAAASLIAVAVALIGLGGQRAVRVSIAVAAVLVVATLLALVALGAGYRPGDGGAVTRALTERRLVLWHESLHLIAADPTGVGPGRFKDVDPTALRDADAHWAHDEPLQQGVELGWAGLALFTLVFVWGFARLWVRPSPDMVVALGAASLAALGMHAVVDYVLHFPAVPLTAAALIGTAQAVPQGRSRRDGHEHRQESGEGVSHAVGAAGAPATR